ncbi:unnamed protein product [Arabidopsis lyrata]|uniref:PRMT5 TIM barrel domain-containing protein n=1 Tax=Arabidopsis lyrata subsp. lyrata TaxID=81972 RepID=D7ME62_ARALL|nr:hypothetical protein ARALYDRAFT_914393 [Arabidopsis lyrata subsp. lyrata]CAH8275741.1 unnamed protein product [Arabidopsis lyrata]
MGKISSWTDLDSEDEVLRMDSETTLKQEVAWATHLSLHNAILEWYHLNTDFYLVSELFVLL